MLRWSEFSLKKCLTSRPNFCHNFYHGNETGDNEEDAAGCPFSVLFVEQCYVLSDAFLAWEEVFPQDAHHSGSPND